ncbi:MAG: alpha/beta hydrolase, partial [Gammaproteobacteria bacterium]
AQPTPEVARVENRRIPGPAGDLPVRIYWPDATQALPVLVYFHGGGWVIGDLDSHDAIARALANAAGHCVVSVHYRLAPEARYPAAVDDAYAATAWVSEHAAELGVDARRLSVAGDSAGGNLATVVCLLARDRSTFDIRSQTLTYPVTDYNFDTDSYRVNGTGECGLGEAEMRWFWDHYLATPERGLEIQASPLRCEDLSGLPPALVITAQYDPLRDEAEAYAGRLRDAGVLTTLTRYPGVVHGFLGQAAWVPEGRQAIAQIGDALRSLCS